LHRLQIAQIQLPNGGRNLCNLWMTAVPSFYA